MAKSRSVSRILLCAIGLVSFDSSCAEATEALRRVTAAIRTMDEAAVIDLVPLQSGLQYVGCPNCDAGRQERQLTWSIARPDEVVCQFCQHRYPSQKYPMDQALAVTTPRGEPARFEYWEDENGYRHFFRARRDDEVRKFLASQTLRLAQLYQATGDRHVARRAAVILDRFAQVFPSWCYHYDYPFRQKEIYDGEVPPEKFRPGFRTARWNWWAYHDIPLPLVDAFQILRGSGVFDELSDEQGVDVVQRIEHDLLRNAGEQVFANGDDCSNMSPSVWRSLIRLGRVIEEPRYIHAVVRRLRRLVDEKFFYDRFWCEGTPSYHLATITALERVIAELEGYSDPPGYIDPEDGVRFDNLDVGGDLPEIKAARAAVEQLAFPDGRLVPVHDTWAEKRRLQPRAAARPFLLPALGHACLGGGSGVNHSQWHLTWSGGYGHQHADALSLILFSGGRELLSDLGYTHTAYRSWTTAAAAHNTVVIDGLNQRTGSRQAPTDGTLLLTDFSDARVQVVRADGARAYPEAAKQFRRTLLVVDAGGQRRYAVDLFEVEGGQTHDYFLHGCADFPTEAAADIRLSPLPTLLPATMSWTPTRNEGETSRVRDPHYAYGFLRSLQQGAMPAEHPTRVEFLPTADRPAATDDLPPTLRVWMWGDDQSQLVLGKNPSVRLAHEDDAKLDQHWRPFLMVRRTANGSRSGFLTLLEPQVGAPLIRNARRLDEGRGPVVLEVVLEDRVDYLVLATTNDAPSEAVDVASDVAAQFRGEIGCLSVRQGAVQYAYAVGGGGWSTADFELESPGPQGGRLVQIDQDALVVEGTEAAAPTAGDVIRVVTADGWVYPFNVRLVERPELDEPIRIYVDEELALAFDPTDSTLKLTAFPQRGHQGDVRVEWQSAVSWSDDPGDGQR